MRWSPDWWSTAGLVSSARSAVTSRCWTGCAPSGLTGCKEGCAEGECGACAVLVARAGRAGPDPLDRDQRLPGAGRRRSTSRRSSRPRAWASPGQLHPVQREMADRGGSQCGYCTPGFICSMAAEYYRPGRRPAVTGAPGHGRTGRISTPRPTAIARPGTRERRPRARAERLRPARAVSGNLCRCTGYRPIRDAAYALGQPEAADPLLARLAEPAPAAAATTTSNSARAATSARPTWPRPSSCSPPSPDAQLVAGSTDWGVELNIRHARAALTIGIDRLAELRELAVGRDRIDIGAALTLSEIEARLAGRVPLLAELFPQFASRLIRNGATLGGNLGTASPIGDTPPALLALDASLVLASSRGRAGGPAGRLLHRLPAERQAPRRADQDDPDPAAAGPGHRVPQDRQAPVRRHLQRGGGLRAARCDGDGRVASIKIGLGGVAATPLRATATEEALTGRPWTRETVAAAADELARAGTPMSDHRASAGLPDRDAAQLAAQVLRREPGSPTGGPRS